MKRQNLAIKADREGRRMFVASVVGHRTPGASECGLPLPKGKLILANALWTKVKVQRSSTVECEQGALSLTG